MMCHRVIPQSSKQKIFGMTCIEILTVVGIVGLLMGIIMPALTRARLASQQIVCASRLGQIGLAMDLYIADTTFYPAAYLHQGDRIEHWSGMFQRTALLTDTVFECPTAMDHGLPPANMSKRNLDSEQNSDGLEDNQAPRCAYTVNEALCPRDRFLMGVNGTVRASKYVRGAQVKSPALTIVATEWTDQKELITQDSVCRSYLPVHGFQSMGSKGTDRFDLNQAGQARDRPCLETGLFRRVFSDLLFQCPSPDQPVSRLNWVGRRHGLNRQETNFVYADGHVTRKSIWETVDDQFEWGQAVYSIRGGHRVSMK